MNFGMGQRVNPHTLRTVMSKNEDKSFWINEDSKNKEFYHNSDLSISNFGLFERKIKLEKRLGKQNYKKIVKRAKTLRR